MKPPRLIVGDDGRTADAGMAYINGPSLHLHDATPALSVHH